MPAPELEDASCDLCGGRDSRVRFSAAGAASEDSFVATTDQYGAYGTIRECRCGMLYTSPRLKAGALLDEYAATEDAEFLSQSEARCINAYLALAAIRSHVPGGRLLDVGCANGLLLNAARPFFEVEGVEPSRWARAYARERLGVEIRHATLEEARFPAGRFDVVSLVDVIEHVPSPRALVAELARVTRPGGVLYLVTPDAASLSARLLGARWWGLRPAHIHYFTRATLSRLLAGAGYEVVWRRSYGRIFMWGYWLSRLANYPRALRAPLSAFIRTFDLELKFLYLDTRDSVQLIARRR